MGSYPGFQSTGKASSIANLQLPTRLSLLEKRRETLVKLLTISAMTAIPFSTVQAFWGSNPDKLADDKSIFQYQMHTLPDSIAESIGTSTLFAAWNAATYVAQIDDSRLEGVLASNEYLEATANVLHKNDGLWFNDESFVISRRKT